jgi:hypothetical protein
MALSVTFSIVIGSVLLLLILSSIVYLLETIYQWTIKIKENFPRKNNG